MGTKMKMFPGYNIISEVAKKVPHVIHMAFSQHELRCIEKSSVDWRCVYSHQMIPYIFYFETTQHRMLPCCFNFRDGHGALRSALPTLLCVRVYVSFGTE